MKQALILAGGKGTRLSNIDKNIPKPMVEISGKPLLLYQIELCRKFGFTNIYILIHHKGDVIKKYFGDGEKFKVKITYQEEKFPRGTAGAVIDLYEELDNDFLVLYGDTFLDIDLKTFFKSHIEKRVDATLFVHPNSHPYDSDLIELDTNNFIKKIHPYPHKSSEYKQNLVNAALYAINKKCLDIKLDDNESPDFAKDFFPQLLINKGKIIGYKSQEYIKDIGTPDRLDAVIKDLENNKVQKLSSSNKKIAIFLDRDGTINKEIGHISHPQQIELINGAAEGIKQINNSGLLAVVMTNQAVIARGECTEQQLKEIHNKIETNLGENGSYLDHIYYCPHHPDSGFKGEVKKLKINCTCRKPNTGLFMKAKKEMNIDLNQSWMIGDSTSDILAAKNLGMKNILINTGLAGRDYKYAVVPDYIFFDLQSGLEWIIKEHIILKVKAEHFIQKIKDKRFIFIGGLARSGKSTWAQVIKESLSTENNNAIHKISLDSWLLPKDERTEGNIFNRFNMDGINDFIKKVSNQNKQDVIIDLPNYDRINMDYSPKSISYRIKPNDTLIIEGVPALCIEDKDLEKFSFFIECEEDVRKERMKIDYQWRKIQKSNFENLYNERLSDEIPYIKKSKSKADLVL